MWIIISVVGLVAGIFVACFSYQLIECHSDYNRGRRMHFEPEKPVPTALVIAEILGFLVFFVSMCSLFYQAFQITRSSF